MHGSATVGWMLAALCVFVAVVCLWRARGAGGMRRRTAANEALMGLGMAGMALPVEGALSPLALLVLFGAVGVRELALLRQARREAGRLRRLACPERAEPPWAFRHHLHHLVGAAAMIHMALAAPASHGGPAGAGGHAAAGAAASGLPLLTGGLIAYYAIHVLRGGLHLLPAAPAGGSAAEVAPGRVPAAVPRAASEAPGLPAACRVAMATGMLTMLLAL